ncbi:MAG: fumarylacetoacetate hydrolase family protein [Anaerolineae bacterium]|nr:fumarylacetoacetate hydrolase family protein [Anaerolineae bacterium]
MKLTKHRCKNGPRWAVDGQYLPLSFTLGMLLECPKENMYAILDALPRMGDADGPLMAPLDAGQEVWASGVTYLRSRDARESESATGDIYMKVYLAQRPELFFKAQGWRVVANGDPIRVRNDSTWDVPEPELTLVINSALHVVGYCVGNDVSSRNIEGENPLYLPQAKVYRGSCALGPAVVLEEKSVMQDLPIKLDIYRNNRAVFHGETSTSLIQRDFEELAAYLGRELDFPQGVLLMTGTGIVPPDDFTLMPGDSVRITIAGMILENPVSE